MRWFEGGIPAAIQTSKTNRSLFIVFVAGNADVFEVTPSNFTEGVTPEVNLNCNIKDLLSAVNQVFVIQIDLEESGTLVPVATVSPTGITINSPTLSNRAVVTGNVDDFVNGPYINIKLMNPVKQDSGSYVCLVSITDKTFAVAKLQFDANLYEQALNTTEVIQLIVSSVDRINKAEQKVQDLTIHLDVVLQQNKDLRQNLTSLTDEHAELWNNMTSIEQRLLIAETQLITVASSTNTSQCDCNFTATVAPTVDPYLTDLVNNLSNKVANLTVKVDDIDTAMQTSINNVVTMPQVLSTTAPSCCNNVSVLTTEISTLQSKVAKFDRSVHDLSTNLTVITSDVVGLETNVDSNGIRIGVLEPLVTSELSELTSLQNQIGRFPAQYQAFSGRRAYYAENSSNQNVIGDIKFITVLEDNMNAYDVATGILTIKHAGYYMMTVTLSLSMTQSAFIEAAIKVNDNYEGFLATSGTGVLNSGSTTLIKKLIPGDTVRVQITKASSNPVVLNENRCSFAVVFVAPP